MFGIVKIFVKNLQLVRLQDLRWMMVLSLYDIKLCFKYFYVDKCYFYF